ncbi:copper resistance protein CopC [Planococcus donghaensis MPA1U2]|uniref:Copper resistance protein CopC n=1 Tax=Planococcus donghaensis MPA1U2 TaxID=933115 RepID=E7RGI1_9BACL|nr:copper resistance CopC family protein [Planococcus donghaensis]EGA89956.1 copper resistance protein CopC [Planococcus donghaensis MPA1U2]
MYKKFLALFFLMFIFPFPAQAHTTLLSSAPSEDQNVSEKLTEVELLFDTNIEEGSTMNIEDETSSFEFEEIAINKNGMIGNFDKTLPDGSYRIVWNIIGEDGHPVEGQIAFNMANEVEKGEASMTTSVTEEKAKATEKKLAETATEKNSNVLIPLVWVLGAVLVVYGIYKLRLKKK